MKNKKLNIRNLMANANALPTNDLQKVKGGRSQPPPCATSFSSEPPPFGAETFTKF